MFKSACYLKEVRGLEYEVDGNQSRYEGRNGGKEVGKKVTSATPKFLRYVAAGLTATGFYPRYITK